MPLNTKINLNPNLFTDKAEQQTTRQGFGEALVQAGKENPNIVATGADLSISTTTAMFQKEFPDRFVQCGIAEQNMMDVAAGMALEGKIPFVATYAVFSPGLNWSQLRVSVLQNNANVKIIGAHAGVSVGPDGASHQALEDIAITRCLPGLKVLAPCDYFESKKATAYAAKTQGPIYFRLAREKTMIMTTEKTPFDPGKAEIFWESSKEKPDAAIFACGPLLYNALAAAKQMEELGMGIIVVNNHSIKPLDETTVEKIARQAGAVVTVEEHQVAGGMGSAIAEFLAQKFPVPIEFVGVKDSFGESGQPDELIEKYGMSPRHIIEAVKKAISRK